MWSRDVIKEGSRWKIGNGLSINTHRDFWISGLSEQRIKSNISYDDNTLVSDLINPDGEWNIEKANSLFLPYELNAIKRTPILGNQYDDRRFWRFEKNGSYSVKSGYWNSFKKNHPCGLARGSSRD